MLINWANTGMVLASKQQNPLTCENALPYTAPGRNDCSGMGHKWQLQQHARPILVYVRLWAKRHNSKLPGPLVRFPWPRILLLIGTLSLSDYFLLNVAHVDIDSIG